MIKTTSKTRSTTPASKPAATSGKAAAAAPKPRMRRSARKSAPILPPSPPAVAATTKQSQLAALLLRDEGATLDQMIALTGWLPHTTRAALTGLRKKGFGVDSDKVDGVRTYRAVAP